MSRTDEEKRVESLKQQIEAITRRPVVSNDLRYLEKRLEDLKARKANGEEVRRRPSQGATNMSISMPEDAREAMFFLMDKEHLGASQLVRRALGEFAKRHGYPEQAECLLEE